MEADELDDWTFIHDANGVPMIVFNRMIYFKGVHVSHLQHGSFMAQFGIEEGIIMAGHGVIVTMQLVPFLTKHSNGKFTQMSVPVSECTFVPKYELL